jgi:hypothetical protein
MQIDHRFIRGGLMNDCAVLGICEGELQRDHAIVIDIHTKFRVSVDLLYAATAGRGNAMFLL